MNRRDHKVWADLTIIKKIEKTNLELSKDNETYLHVSIRKKSNNVKIWLAWA